MRWKAKPEGLFRPSFALLPRRMNNDQWLWLEPFWVRFHGNRYEWCTWDVRPNDIIRAKAAQPNTGDADNG